MRPRIVRSPVDICFGTRPSQAAKSRPLVKAAPSPMAATMALAMIGPMPGTVINCRQFRYRAQYFDLFRDVLNALIETSPIAAEVLDDPAHTRRQYVDAPSQDVRKLLTKE